MNLKIVILLILLSVNLLNAQTTAILDSNFEQALIDLGYDSGIPDGSVITANIDAVTSLSISFKNITSLIGIEDFEKLETLTCDNNELTGLDLSQNTLLTELTCYQNVITSLDVTQNTLLTTLNCSDNELTSLDVTQNTLLTRLICSSNELTSLDVTQNTLLDGLWSVVNELTSLDVTQNTLLTFLNCANNELTNLDVTQNTLLTDLSCAINELTNLDVSQNIMLTELRCYYNNLTSLDVSQNIMLTDLRCDNNKLICLNVKNGNNTNLIFNAINNPDLQCIEVDDPIWSTSNWPNVDSNETFNIECTQSCIVVDIDNIEIDLIDFKIYPNPNVGNFSIKIDQTIPEIDLVLINDLGQKVLEQSFYFTNNIKLNIKIPNGIYFIQLQLPSGDSEIIKMVKIE